MAKISGSVLNKFNLRAAVLSEPVLALIARELNSQASEVTIQVDDIRKMLVTEVIRPDITDGQVEPQPKRHTSKEARLKLSKIVAQAVRAKFNASTAEA